MKVLIYIEPQIEHDAPLHKSNWVGEWVPRVAMGLSAGFPSALEMVAVAADHLVERAPQVGGLRWVGIPQRSVTDLFTENALATRVRRFKEGRAGTAARLHAERIVACLAGFVPDCVVGLSDAGFLKTLFPQAAIVQHEYGPFSRSPFPESFFFDPCGVGGTAWLNRYWRGSVETWTPRAEQLAVAREFMEVYCSAVEGANPFADYLAQARSQFARFAMLPIHLHGQPLYDGLTDVASPLQLVQACLESLPGDTGLLVAAHPGGRMLDGSVSDYLTSRYPAFLMPQAGRWFAAPSQYLVPASDSVICVSSTVAALTLFWGNAYVAAGRDYLTFLAAADVRQPWPQVSALTLRQRERFIAWLLFRFLAVDADVRDGAWMHAVVEGALACERQGHHAGFYEGMPERSADVVRERWVKEVRNSGARARFERDAERYVDGVNRSDDAVWGSLESELDQLAGQMPLTAGRASFHFHKAMAAINRKGDRLLAAGLFAVARDEYATFCSASKDERLREMFWHSAFHVPFALRDTSERCGYKEALMQLMCDVPTAAGAMPERLRQRLGELLG